MRPATACPDTRTLEQFLLGRTPEEKTEQLEEHVAACSACADNLKKVRAEDDLVAAMRTASTPDPEDVRLARAVTPLLKQMYSQKDMTATLPPAPALGTAVTIPPPGAPSTVSGGANRTGIMLDFLAPARAAGEIGRLGPFRVLQVLGAGGMGVVFRAEDPRLQRIVAIKAIKTGLAAGADAHQRFLHEARSAAKIAHDNIVTIHEVNEDRGVPYLVMPLLRGLSLEERMRAAGGPLPLAELLDIGRQIAEGLAAAHAHGLVHRDIKPANIFLESGGRASGIGDREAAAANQDTAVIGDSEPALNPDARSPTPDARVKILDFGLVQALGGNPMQSHQGMIVGTPAYMAPEQASRQTVDGRADLFSLGCVLYQAATGKNPFAGPDVMSTLIRIAADAPQPMRELNPDILPELDALIMRLLAKRPEERPADAQTVADELRTMQQKLEAPPRPGPLRWMLAAAVLAAAVALIVWFVRPPSPDGNAPPAPPPPPGEITFSTDEPGLHFTLLPAEGDAKEIDVKQTPKHELPPGNYVLKANAAAGKRKLWPNRLAVQAGETRKVPLCLVGEVRAYKGHAGTVTGVAMPAKNGLLVLSAGGVDRTIAVWDATKDVTAPDAILHSLEGHKNAVSCVAVSADGARAVSGSGGKGGKPDLTARVWDLKTGMEIACCREHEHFVTAVALSQDGKRALSGDAEGRVVLWDADNGKRLLTLKEPDMVRVNALTFAPDGKGAASAGEDGAVKIWKTDMGALQKALAPIKSQDTKETIVVTGVAFAPAGTWLALACGDGTLRVWDWQTDKVPRSWPAHQGAAKCVAVAPDGKRLLSGGADNVVRLWDATSGTEIYALEGHTKAVNGVAFAADHRHAASGGADQTVRLWRLPD